MNPSQFEALAREGYNRITLVHECPADLETPLSVYLKLANRPDTVLLESVEGGMRFARYSFIGLAARTKLRARNTSEGPVTDIVTDGAVSRRFPSLKTRRRPTAGSSRSSPRPPRSRWPSIRRR